MSTAIFDLDGTLSDPSAGITGALNHALAELGYRTRPRSELLRYIGPPLSDNFRHLMPESSDSERNSGIALFREYYQRKGFRENQLYPGVPEMLFDLRESGIKLCLATGKKTSTAYEVLRYFKLSELFDIILGSADGGTKTDILLEILFATTGKVVMIGDRIMDFKAAAETGIPSIGAEWGFGDETELSEATYRAATPESAGRKILQLL